MNLNTEMDSVDYFTLIGEDKEEEVSLNLTTTPTSKSSSGARTSKVLFPPEANQQKQKGDTVLGHPVSNPIRKAMFRWKACHDLALINEVEKENPFQDAKRWSQIAETFNFEYPMAGIDSLGARRRFNILITSFKKDDWKKRYASGTEETIGPIEEKLGKLAELMESLQLQAKVALTKKEKKAEDSKEIGETIRDAALTGCKRKGEDESTSNKRASEKGVFEMLQSKQDMETKRFDRDYELRMAQLEFDRQQFEHRRKVEETELRLREEQQKAQIDTQRAMLELLLKKM